MSKGYGMFAAAIVNQAVKDWKDAVSMLEKVPDHVASVEMKTECEKFFSSEWYQDIRELAPDVIPENMMRRLTDDRT